MTISAELHDARCLMAIETSIVGAGRYRCRIRVMRPTPNGKYDTSPIFKAERGAENLAQLHDMVRDEEVRRLHVVTHRHARSSAFEHARGMRVGTLTSVNPHRAARSRMIAAFSRSSGDMCGSCQRSRRRPAPSVRRRLRSDTRSTCRAEIAYAYEVTVELHIMNAGRIDRSEKRESNEERRKDE
ncbi:TPA: hypothetical protein QDB09_001677 [Burkholderia vietnamiensis]|nr:hypothetical protein [Burkholderia vietnamiensis]